MILNPQAGIFPTENVYPADLTPQLRRESGKRGSVRRAGAPTVLLPSAVKHGRELDFGSGIEASNSFWAVELVG